VTNYLLYNGILAHLPTSDGQKVIPPYFKRDQNPIIQLKVERHNRYYGVS
jgi:hypothetical protein